MIDLAAMRAHQDCNMLVLEHSSITSGVLEHMYVINDGAGTGGHYEEGWREGLGEGEKDDESRANLLPVSLKLIDYYNITLLHFGTWLVHSF